MDFEISEQSSFNHVYACTIASRICPQDFVEVNTFILKSVNPPGLSDLVIWECAKQNYRKCFLIFASL